MCISESGRDDEPAIWVWVNDIVLDSGNEALILDCCVMPVGQMGDAVSAQLGVSAELDSIRRDGAGAVVLKVIILDFTLSLLKLACAPRHGRKHRLKCVQS